MSLIFIILIVIIISIVFGILMYAIESAIFPDEHYMSLKEMWEYMFDQDGEPRDHEEGEEDCPF